MSERRDILTDEMRRLIEEQRLCYVATADAVGAPNLSAKGTLVVWDANTLAFADIRSPRTVANLRVNPRIEVNVVDPIARKGYRFKGTAEAHTDGAVFERGMRLYYGTRRHKSYSFHRRHPRDARPTDDLSGV